VVATLTDFAKKRDSRRILLRSTLSRAEDGSLLVTPAKNQSSGLFSTLHRANCLAVLPEGVPESKRIEAGTRVTCLLLDVEEGTVF
jgi:molybdopterin molybdotransferase